MIGKANVSTCMDDLYIAIYGHFDIYVNFSSKNFIGWDLGFWKKIGEIEFFFFNFLSMNSIFLVDLWVTTLIQGDQTHNGHFENARNDK